MASTASNEQPRTTHLLDPPPPPHRQRGESEGPEIPLESLIRRPIYFAVLISHVLLSVVTFPMILTSFYLGLSNRLATHRRLSKWTWAGWIYVSVTGVVVYFMLHVIRW